MVWFLNDRDLRYERIDGGVQKKNSGSGISENTLLSSISRIIFKVSKESRTSCESYLNLGHLSGNM